MEVKRNDFLLALATAALTLAMYAVAFSAVRPMDSAAWNLMAIEFNTLAPSPENTVFVSLARFVRVAGVSAQTVAFGLSVVLGALAIGLTHFCSKVLFHFFGNETMTDVIFLVPAALLLSSGQVANGIASSRGDSAGMLFFVLVLGFTGAKFFARTETYFQILWGASLGGLFSCSPFLGMSLLPFCIWAVRTHFLVLSPELRKSFFTKLIGGTALGLLPVSSLFQKDLKLEISSWRGLSDFGSLEAYWAAGWQRLYAPKDIDLISNLKIVLMTSSKSITPPGVLLSLFGMVELAFRRKDLRLAIGFLLAPISALAVLSIHSLESSVTFSCFLVLLSIFSVFGTVRLLQLLKYNSDCMVRVSASIVALLLICNLYTNRDVFTKSKTVYPELFFDHVQQSVPTPAIVFLDDANIYAASVYDQLVSNKMPGIRYMTSEFLSDEALKNLIAEAQQKKIGIFGMSAFLEVDSNELSWRPSGVLLSFSTNTTGTTGPNLFTTADSMPRASQFLSNDTGVSESLRRHYGRTIANHGVDEMRAGRFLNAVVSFERALNLDPTLNQVRELLDKVKPVSKASAFLNTGKEE
jgi:hypothetical protein